MRHCQLVIDIGNTAVKLGLFESHELVCKSTFLGHYDDEVLFKQSLSASVLSLAEQGRIVSVMACSVVPRATDWVQTVFLEALQNLPTPVFVTGESQNLPLDLGPYPQQAIGADRVVGIAAARFLYPDQMFILVNFGTATTIDAVSAEGQFLGGVIIPGVLTMATCLNQATAQLPVSQSIPVTSAFGLDSQSCLNIGLSMGYRGMLTEIVAAMKQEMPKGEIVLLATGGAYDEAQLFLPPDFFTALHPHLILEGLNSLGLALTSCP